MLVEDNERCPSSFSSASRTADWYELLRRLPALDEVNFWAPGGRALQSYHRGRAPLRSTPR